VPGLIGTADDEVAFDPNQRQFQEEAPDGLSVDQIVGNMEAYEGQNVALTAEVAQVVSERGFTLGNPQLLQDDLLVLASPQLVGAGMNVENDVLGSDPQRVMVEGTVVRLNVDQIEQLWGVELDREALGDYQDRPVLLAQQIVRVNQQTSN
jgi:hypothetical protein